MGVLFTSKDRIEIVKINDGHYVVMADELEMLRTPSIELNTGFRSKCYGALVKEVDQKQKEVDSLQDLIKKIKENMRMLSQEKFKEREKRMQLEKLVLKLNLKLLEITENRSF